MSGLHMNILDVSISCLISTTWPLSNNTYIIISYPDYTEITKTNVKFAKKLNYDSQPSAGNSQTNLRTSTNSIAAVNNDVDTVPSSHIFHSQSNYPETKIIWASDLAWKKKSKLLPRFPKTPTKNLKQKYTFPKIC